MSGPRILVVDDDPDIQLALRARLRANGYEVCCAGDGGSALAAASERLPDLILLDIQLPDQDGYSVLAELKGSADLCRVPVVMLSAQDPASAEQRALDSGATAYCPKPFTSRELLDTIANALPQKSEGG